MRPSLSLRPTLITIFFFAGFEIFSMKNVPRVGPEPTTFVSVLVAHRANHLRHRGWRPRKNSLNFNAIKFNYWPCVVVCVGFTNSKQHTNKTRAACYKVVGSNPVSAKYFSYLNLFNWGIADGAKVGLKLRLDKTIFSNKL